jgi:Tyosinase C-terminal domain
VLESSKSYLGSVYTFSSGLEREGNTVACQNCRSQQQNAALSTGQIPINSALLTHARDENIPELESLLPEAVENYLKLKLTWVAVEV